MISHITDGSLFETRKQVSILTGEFVQDLIQFLVSRGHGKHVPHGGPDQFPEAVLNGGKLDLYNLYKKVVSRGGFHVGNGINWKGQIFSKTGNHTTIYKMIASTCLGDNLLCLACTSSFPYIVDYRLI